MRTGEDRSEIGSIVRRLTRAGGGAARAAAARRRRVFRRPRLLAGPLAILLAAQPLAAATLNWIDPAGGTAATASNWNPAQLPVAADDLVFNVASGGYSVLWSSSVPDSNRHTYRVSTVTNTFTFPHTVATALVVGSQSGDNASMRITTGTLSSVGNVQIGNATGSTGNLQVIDDDAFLEVTGATSDVFVGQSGTGSLNVTGGGSVTAVDDIVVGSNVSGNGTLTVTGFDAGSLVPSGVFSTNGDLVIGRVGASTGAATLTNGSSSAVAFDVVLAPEGGSGTLTVEDAGGSPAELYVQRNLEIAHNTSALAGGTAIVNVNHGGRVFVTATTNVGDANGGTASLHLEGDALLETGSLIAVGGLDLDGGTLRVVGGTFDPPGTTLNLLGADGPIVELDDASLSLSATTSNALTLGNGSTLPGTLRLLNNASVGIGGSSADVLVRGGGGAGLLEVLSGSTFNGDRNFTNQGTATVGADSRLESFNHSLSGTTTVSGTGSELEAGGTLTNSGTLTLGPGSLTTAAQGSNSGSLSTASTSLLSVTNTFTNSGAISMNLGQITAGTLDFDASGTLAGRGTVAARVLMDSSAASITATTGSLTLGNAVDTAGFFSTGTLNVGSQTVTLHDANAATLGNVTLANGTLNAANGAVLAAGTSISGHGRVNADVANSGSILPTGAGLNFGGTLTGVGQGISGTKVTFLNGGGFVGAGNMAASVDIDAGGSVQATGTLSMGLPSDTAGWVSDGLLAVGPYKVGIADANAALIGNVTISAGGLLDLPSAGGTLATGRSISGAGRINGDVANSGSILPSGTGLEFAGTLAGAGQSTSGTRLTFLNGGGFSGSGLLDAEIDADAGSTITAGAAGLTMGRSFSNAGVVLDGVLNVGAGVVTLLDANSIGLGSATSLSGGTLLSTQTLALVAGRVLAGLGTINTPGFTAFGTLRPGGYLGGPAGELIFSKDYVQRSGSSFEAEVRGTTPGVSHDRIVVGDEAALDGHLGVAITGGFSPVVGDAFTLLTASSLSGYYSSWSITGLPPNTAAVLAYTPTSVVLQVLADGDGDGMADLFDCAPSDPDAFEIPEVGGLAFLDDTVTINWSSAVPASGAGTVHHVLRGDLRDFPVATAASVFCLASGLSGSSTTDTDQPASRAGFYYLVGGENACGVGPYGVDGGGTPYTLGVCP